MAYQRQTWVNDPTKTSGGLTAPGTEINAEKLNHMEDGIAAGGGVSTFAELTDVEFPVLVVDQAGNEVSPGAQDGDVPQYDGETGRLAVGPLPVPDFTGVYQPYDTNLAKFFVPAYRITAATPAVPSDFPDLGVKFDELHPDADLAFSVNTVTSATGAITLPDPGVYTASRLVMTGNCTVSLPSAGPGQTVYLLAQQDATGGRTLSVGPSTAIAWGGRSSNAQPTMPTVANSALLLEFRSYGDSFWRCVNYETFGATTVSAKVAPSLRGSAFGSTTGTSNTSGTSTSPVTVTLPTGIVSGDRGRILVVRDGTDSPSATSTLNVPSGWTKVETQTATAITTFLLERDMAATDSGTTVNISFTLGTATAVRVTVVGCVVKGAAATGEVRVLQAAGSSGASATVPAYTPPADNSLVLVFSGVRFATSTNPTVAPSSGSPLTEVLEVTEGRAAQVNFTAYLASRTLSGQGSLAQAADALALTGANGVTESYVVVMPPA